MQQTAASSRAEPTPRKASFRGFTSNSPQELELISALELFQPFAAGHGHKAEAWDQVLSYLQGLDTKREGRGESTWYSLITLTACQRHWRRLKDFCENYKESCERGIGITPIESRRLLAVEKLCEDEAAANEKKRKRDKASQDQPNDDQLRDQSLQPNRRVRIESNSSAASGSRIPCTSEASSSSTSAGFSTSSSSARHAPSRTSSSYLLLRSPITSSFTESEASAPPLQPLSMRNGPILRSFSSSSSTGLYLSSTSSSSSASLAWPILGNLPNTTESTASSSSSATTANPIDHTHSSQSESGSEPLDQSFPIITPALHQPSSKAKASSSSRTALGNDILKKFDGLMARLLNGSGGTVAVHENEVHENEVHENEEHENEVHENEVHENEVLMLKEQMNLLCELVKMQQQEQSQRSKRQHAGLLEALQQSHSDMQQMMFQLQECMKERDANQEMLTKILRKLAQDA